MIKIFWLLVIVGILIWYLLVASRVAIRGYRDIRTMLDELHKTHSLPKSDVRTREEI